MIDGGGLYLYEPRHPILNVFCTEKASMDGQYSNLVQQAWCALAHKLPCKCLLQMKENPLTTFPTISEKYSPPPYRESTVYSNSLSLRAQRSSLPLI